LKLPQLTGRAAGAGGQTCRRAGTRLQHRDPAQDRPGGRGGRDLDLGAPVQPSGQDPALARPGGRGGRDVDFSPAGSGSLEPISLDRPGGRGGREPVGGGGGGGGDGGSGGDSGSGDEWFTGGQLAGGFVVYIGVLAAAWYGHQAFFAKDTTPGEELLRWQGQGG